MLEGLDGSVFKRLTHTVTLQDNVTVGLHPVVYRMPRVLPPAVFG